METLESPFPANECISRLKKLPEQYASVKLAVAVHHSGKEYRFEVKAKGVSRNLMDMTLYGRLKQKKGDLTLAIIEEVKLGHYGYFLQYAWLAIPVIMIFGLINQNPQILWGILLAIGISIITRIENYFDRKELIRIIERALSSPSTDGSE
jgi:hypothetical protein